jgi:hypothetical protein
MLGHVAQRFGTRLPCADPAASETAIKATTAMAAWILPTLMDLFPVFAKFIF